LTALVIFFGGGDEDFMASSQQLERTSSSIPVFFLGIFSEKAAREDGQDNRVLCMLSIDFMGGGSVRTGEVRFDLRSIGSRLVAQLIIQKLCKLLQQSNQNRCRATDQSQISSSPNPFINKKPPLQCLLVTTTWQAVHQTQGS
jgi:hypothetical protein